jgi:diguanylate cyclase (GGDEF)-like protein
MIPVAATILIVDDELQNRKLLEALLRPEGYLTVCAASGVEALALVAVNAPDLILLDVMMPQMDGFDVVTLLKANPATSNIPVIMITAQIDRGARVAGLSAGAEEFLTKPVDRIELWLRVRNLLRLKALGDFQREHSTILEAEVRARTLELQRLAHYDGLTGLPNRTLFYETLTRMLDDATVNGGTVAVMCIDLDLFKNVNDTYGHACGDELLRQFSNRLVASVRYRDTAGRLGGDEFSLTVQLTAGQEGAMAVADAIREALCTPFDLNGILVSVTASIGIAVHPFDATNPDVLVKFADAAMYRAKQAGGDAVCFFTAQMNVDHLARVELVAALRYAVDHEQFVLHYQPKAHIGSGKINGFEALIRWQRPGYGLIPPLDFISVLEETGLIIRVGSWVIATACRQMGLWLQSDIGPVSVSVNVSGRQFVEGNLEGDILTALAGNHLDGELLELELTESSLMANTERTLTSLQNLRRCGVQISIDDFGTGYSSLAYLRRFPIDKLKIDIAFIREVTRNADDAAIVLAIIRMAHSLRLVVIAEGVETPEQLASLRKHRCDHIQGYYLSPPVPLAAAESMLREGRRLTAGRAH